MAKKKKQFQNYCVFCGKPGLTKEHVWADWLKDYLPRIADASQHQTSLSFGQPDQSRLHTPVIPGRLHGKGDPYSKKLRIMCSSCNNEWGSGLQTKATPILVQLLKGHDPQLDISSLETLSAWISMFVCVAEFSDPATVAITPQERKSLREKSIAPNTFHIWIGMVDGDGSEVRGFNHFGHTGGGAIFLTGNGPVTPNTFPSQSTAFTVGKLFCLCFSSAKQPLPSWSSEINRHPLKKIWPITTLLTSSKLREMTPDEADRASLIFVPPLERSGTRAIWGNRR